MIDVQELWKVFGAGDPSRGMALARDGADRATIQKQVGQVIGVRNVSFQVAPGESFVVMGLSGSGKSTLIRCLSGLHDASAGSIRIDDVDMVGIEQSRLRELRRSKMSMVFQHFGLFPHRKVIDNIAYGLEVQGIDKTERRKRAGDVLSLVGLDGWADHYPDQLSGGMQQRVGLGRALALDPEILFFDEPFSALDPLIRHDMQDELLRLQREKRRTIVFITHDFDEAIRLGDRIAVMKDGVFEQVGKPEQVVSHPSTDYVRAFTKSVPISKVLRAGSIMDQTSFNSATRSINASTLIERVIPMFLADPSPLAITDDAGVVVGHLTTSQLASVLSQRTE